MLLLNISCTNSLTYNVYKVDISSVILCVYMFFQTEFTDAGVMCGPVVWVDSFIQYHWK